MDACKERRQSGPSAVLIATLGTEPQVVTAACDLLTRQGENLGEVCVVHTVAPGSLLAQALVILRQAFDQAPYRGFISLQTCSLEDRAGRALADVETPDAARAAFQTLYQVVRQAKLNGKRVHLSIAGGRKSLAVFGMAAAQMLFDEKDCLWHLFSGGDFLASKRLHPQPGDDVHLIPIPVILWGRIAPALTDLAQVQDPFAAAERIRKLQLRERLEQARGFILGMLTPAERRVVSLLVKEGCADLELADRLSLSPRTVEQHLRAAYQKAADYWDTANINRTQLVALLSTYSFYEDTGNSG